MDAIRLWVTGLTSAAIIGAIVLALVPGGGVEKTVKTMVSVFLVSAIVMPFAKTTQLKTDIDFSPEESAAEAENSIVGEMSEQMKTKLGLSIENILKKEGIQVHSVSIDIKTDGDEISVEKITVTIKKENARRLSEAKQIVETQLGVRVDVTVEVAEG